MHYPLVRMMLHPIKNILYIAALEIKKLNLKFLNMEMSEILPLYVKFFMVGLFAQLDLTIFSITVTDMECTLMTKNMYLPDITEFKNASNCSEAPGM